MLWSGRLRSGFVVMIGISSSFTNRHADHAEMSADCQDKWWFRFAGVGCRLTVSPRGGRDLWTYLIIRYPHQKYKEYTGQWKEV